jgi:hypothetical protein
MECGRFNIYPDNTDRRKLEAVREEENWLAGIIDPEKIDLIRQYPAYEGHTTEWIIMDALQARIVEHGSEMNPIARQRLRSLVAAFRIMMIPNLNLQEQEFMRRLGAATTIDWSKIQVKVTPELTEDIQWLWETFRLKVSKAQPLPLLK